MELRWILCRIWLLTCFATFLHSSQLPGYSERTPQFTEEPESQTVQPGTPVTLTCQVRPATAEIHWLFNGQYLTESQNGMHIEGGRLRIPEFKWIEGQSGYHDGVYQCAANNSVGRVLSREALLEPAYLGSYPAHVEDVALTVAVGNTALLPCAPVDSNPPRVTLFERDGETITGSSRHHYLPSGALQIGPVKADDAGEYHCVSVNPHTKAKRPAPYTITLNIATPFTNRPVTITQALKSSYEVLQGNNVTFECVVEGAPVPRVSWSKFGGQLPDGRFSQILGNLVLHDLRVEDSGSYVCQGENGVGPAKHSFAQLIVIEPAVLRRPPRDQNATVGSTVSLECIARGSDSIEKEWLFNGEYVFPNQYISITDTSLTISNIQRFHAGMYQCVIRNSFGMATAAARVYVLRDGEILPNRKSKTDLNQQDQETSRKEVAKPLIVVPPSNTTVSTMSTVVMKCSTGTQTDTDGTLPLDWEAVHVVWLKDTDILISDSSPKTPDVTTARQEVTRFKIDHSGDLQIFNARIDDTGLYTCRVSNNAGFANASAYLTVKEDDSDVLTDPDFIDANGRPPRRRKKGKKKKNKNRQLPQDMGGDEEDVEEEEELVVEPPRRRDRKGKNRQVMIPPSKPEVTKLSDTSVKLEWTVVEADDALPITFFKIQYKEVKGGKNKHWQTINENIRKNVRMHEVAGLRPGSTYRFRVVAVYSNNDNKQGPNSRRFTLAMAPELRPQAPVSVPVIVEARPLSTSKIAIKWQHLHIAQSSIEGFFVYYKPFGSDMEFAKQTILGTTEDKHVLSDLQPSTEYTIKMTSFNKAGESSDSNKVVKKTLSYTENPNQRAPPDDWETLLSPLATTVAMAAPGNGIDDDSSFLADNEHSTAASNELLYLVLGVVLGVMMLFLVVFMVMCAWKQRQQRRMMASIAGRNKFHDPSKTIYSDSLRKKQNGAPHFMLNGLNGMNGGAGNGHAVTYNPHANGGSGVNININPFLAHDGKEGNSLQEIRNSINEMMQNSQENTLRRNPMAEDVRGPPPAIPSDCEGCSDEDCPAAASHQPYQPPEYHSLLRPQPPPPPPHSQHSSSSLNHMSSFKPHRRGLQGEPPTTVVDPRTQSPDHIPRLHERLPYRAHDPKRDTDASTGLLLNSSLGASRSPYNSTPKRGHSDRIPKMEEQFGYDDEGGRYDDEDDVHHRHHHRGDVVQPPYYSSDPHYVEDHYEQLPQDKSLSEGVSEHSQSSSSRASSRHKRRRRKVSSAAAATSPNDNSSVKDQGTNTDYSSNDGTLDSHLDSAATSPVLPHTPSPPVRTYSNKPLPMLPDDTGDLHAQEMLPLRDYSSSMYQPDMGYHNHHNHHRHPEEMGYPMISRANDYPPSDQDELED